MTNGLVVGISVHIAVAVGSRVQGRTGTLAVLFGAVGKLLISR